MLVIRCGELSPSVCLGVGNGPPGKVKITNGAGGEGGGACGMEGEHDNRLSHT